MDNHYRALFETEKEKFEKSQLVPVAAPMPEPAAADGAPVPQGVVLWSRHRLAMVRPQGMIQDRNQGKFKG